MALRCQREPPRLHGACVDGARGAEGGIPANEFNRAGRHHQLPEARRMALLTAALLAREEERGRDCFLVGEYTRRVESRRAPRGACEAGDQQGGISSRPRAERARLHSQKFGANGEVASAVVVAGRGVACVYQGARRQRAICSCCCSGGSAVSAMPPARSRRSILWTVRTSGRASLCRHRLQQMQARTLACTRMHECTRAPMPPHAAHCTPQTLRTPRSKLQLVPEQLVLLKGGHGADLATGARDPVAAKLARLPRRAAHAHVQLLQPPPGTRSSGIEQPSP